MEAITIALIVMAFIFFGTTCAFAYACFNLVKKVETYEEWMEKYGTKANQLYDQLKAVDDKNLFERDDDVGITFTGVLDIVKEFNDEFGGEESVQNKI